MEYKDYYQLLGVAKNATDKEIKRAYRRLAQKYHPDKNPGNQSAEARFKEINEAYEVLGTPENRTKYDQLGSNYHRFQQMGGNPIEFDFSQWFANAGGRQQGHVNLGEMFGDQRGGGFSDFFELLFGAGRSGQSMGRRGAANRGTKRSNTLDVTQTVELSLEEAYHGTTRTLSQSGEHFTAKIPAGARTGMKIRLRGKGMVGPRGKGDLFLQVKVKAHPLFSRDGHNLRINVEVDALIATLGGQASVPTLTGPVSLTIPAGTQGGQTFRLKGKGMPQVRNNKMAGDLLAKIQIRIPKSLTSKERALYQELAGLVDEAPA